MPTLPDIPTFRDGVMVHDVDLNALVANIQNLYAVTMGGVGNTTTKPELRLRVTVTTRTCARNTDVAVVWDFADENTDSMWTSGSTITINTTGTYLLNTQVSTDGAFYDGMSLFIVVNGLVTSSNAVACWRDADSNRGRCGATLSMVAGTQITVILNQTAASNRHFSAAGNGCRFSAVYIGPA